MSARMRALETWFKAAAMRASLPAVGSVVREGSAAEQSEAVSVERTMKAASIPRDARSSVNGAPSRGARARMSAVHSADTPLSSVKLCARVNAMNSRM